MREFGQPGRRIDQPGGANAQQNVTRPDSVFSGLPSVGWQPFTKPHHAGTNAPAAMSADRWLESTSAFEAIGVIGDPCWKGVGPIAGETAWCVQTAVDVQHVAAARPFMQIIDILRNQRELGRNVSQLRNGDMPWIRLATLDIVSARASARSTA